jgi:hypothetical protein
MTVGAATGVFAASTFEFLLRTGADLIRPALLRCG